MTQTSTKPLCHIIIPARRDSTRLANKMLAKLGNATVIEQTYQAAKQSKISGQIWVVSDDAGIVELIHHQGGQALLSQNDHPHGSSRVAWAVGKLALSDEDIIVNVQGDEPFIPATLIQQVAQNLSQRQDCHVATLALPITSQQHIDDPNVVKVVCDAHHRALYFSRSVIPFQRQQTTSSYHYLRHIGLYAYRAGWLKKQNFDACCHLSAMEQLEQLNFLYMGAKIHVDLALVPCPKSIDTAKDLHDARNHIAKTITT